MVLTGFVALQLVLDIALVVLILRLRGRREPATTPRPEEPPAWYGDFVMLAEDLLALVEPVLDALETGELETQRAAARVAAPPPAAAPVSTTVPVPLAAASSATRLPAPAPGPSRRERQREAFGLLRSGERPDEVARRVNLLPAEVQLISNLVAAETELQASRRS